MILAQTNEWVVVNKPPRTLTIPPSAPAPSAQSLPILLELAQAESGDSRLWVVHRLDRDTSGVVLFARTAEAHRKANLWFQKHETKKVYHALCEGKCPQPVLRLQGPIEGKPAVTQVECLEQYESGFLAQVRITTGRRHQIRIHLSQKGHPIWGDLQYGGSARTERVALHAFSLELPSGERFEAPWPEDFASWVSRERSKRELK